MDSQPLRVVADPAWSDGNPYLSLLYEAMTPAVELVHGEEPRRGDVVHLHWPDLAVGFRSPLRSRQAVHDLIELLEKATRTGAPVAWTVHNVQPHEDLHPRLRRRLYEALIPSVHGIISLSQTGRGEAVGRFPELAAVPGEVARHGGYLDAYGPAPEREEARASLGIRGDRPVAALFGNLRPYKGARDLASALIASGQGLQVLIAGRIRPARDQRLVRRAANDSRVHVIDRHLSPRELVTVVAAADVCLLPYRSILHSGAAHLALSYGRRVVAPAIGAFPELATAHPDWLTLYQPPLDEGVLRLTWDTATSPPPDELPVLPTWTEAAETHLRLFRRILRNREARSTTSL